MGFVALAGLLAVLAQPAGDVFIAQRDAAAALNPRSPQFTIALKDNQRTFRMGERIPLVFVYDGFWFRRGHHPYDTYLRYANAVIDRPGAATRPYDDFDRAALYVPGGVSCGCGAAGVVAQSPAGSGFGGIAFDDTGRPYVLPNLPLPPPPPPPPPPPRYRVTFLLNEGVRFDVPGRYRLYMADRGDGGSPLISNIVELEIMADEAWAEATARDSATVLDTSRDPETRAEAARTLRFLGTRSAIDEMARRLMVWTADNYIEIAELESGLFGARDRDYAIAAMERQLDDPAVRIRVNHLRVTAALRLTRDTRGPLEPAARQRSMLAVDQRRLRALARTGTLESRLRATFRASAAGAATEASPGAPRVVVTPALAGFAALVENVLTSLSPSRLETALAAHGITLADDDRFAPMLKRFAARGSRIAKVLINDLTLPPGPVETVDTSAPLYVVAGFDLQTFRRRYRVGGVEVPFTGLGAMFAQLTPGTTLRWTDDHEQYLLSWLLNRDREFRRVAEIARRYRVTLARQ